MTINRDEAGNMLKGNRCELNFASTIAFPIVVVGAFPLRKALSNQCSSSMSPSTNSLSMPITYACFFRDRYDWIIA